MQKEAESDISMESRSVSLEPLEVQSDAAPLGAESCTERYVLTSGLLFLTERLPSMDRLD